MYKRGKLTPLDPSGVYALDKEGSLFWLQTPFTASAMEDLPGIKLNTIVTIDQVSYAADKALVYTIGKGQYYAHHFSLAMYEE